MRNGVVGVRDSLTGDFFTLPAGAMSTLTYGGAIDYDGGAVPEAFVQSDGTQFVSTGVRFTPQMRVEADYQ